MTGQQQGPDPTPWELMRVMQSVAEDVRLIRKETLTTEVFRVSQEAAGRRFEALERDLAEWTVESRGEHVRLDGKIASTTADLRALLDTYKAEQDRLGREAEQEKAKRDREAHEAETAKREAEKVERRRTLLTIGVAILGVLGSLAVGLILDAVALGGAA